MSEQKFSEFPDDDKLSIGLAIASFCLPIVGIIIYFTSTSPNKAQSASHAALWGFGIGLVLIILSVAGINKKYMSKNSSLGASDLFLGVPITLRKSNWKFAGSMCISSSGKYTN